MGGVLKPNHFILVLSNQKIVVKIGPHNCLSFPVCTQTSYKDRQ